MQEIAHPNIFISGGYKILRFKATMTLNGLY